MLFRELFIARARRPIEKGAAYAAAEPSGATGVFITPQSLTTFPTASFVVALVWLLAKALFPTCGASPWVPLIVSLLVGAVVFVATTSEPNVRPHSQKEWLVAVVVAILNSLYLAASALGVLGQLGK
jgi:hypothetical protein